MPSHPNRSKKNTSAARNPTTAVIRQAREAAKLTQTQAAELIYCTLRGWQDWESGARRMHPAFFELFRMKVDRTTPTWPDSDGTTQVCECGGTAKNTGFIGEYHCDRCGETWAI
jgi:putative transcriptional regulator